MRVHSLLAAAFLATVTACATRSPVSSTEGTTAVQTAQVVEVRDVATAGGQTTGIGAVVGGVLGAIAGGNVGGGYGSTAAAIGGSLVGGYAGHQLEAGGTSRTSTAVTVRLENGEQHVYNPDSGDIFRVGDTVKLITNGGVTRITH
jgi:outer membrane lipoprotein SlyB